MWELVDFELVLNMKKLNGLHRGGLLGHAHEFDIMEKLYPVMMLREKVYDGEFDPILEKINKEMEQSGCWKRRRMWLLQRVGQGLESEL